MDISSATDTEGVTITNNPSGSFHAQRDAWIANSFRANVQNFNFTSDFADLPQDLQRRLVPHRELLTTGTPEQKRAVALNILYYDGFNAKREHLSLVDTTTESFTWIEDTEWPQWLSRQDDTPCWISGKPGSGKSTLMKYLSENRSTRERLSSASTNKTWHIIHFFFDYRGGSGLQNNIKGLLQLFLGQMVSQIPSVADSLGNLLKDFDKSSISMCTDALCQVIAENSLDVCAFVDGLDEYQGDPWDFYNLVETLRGRASIKFCFASRPEIEITTIFSRMSTINIVLHRYNHSAIKAYVKFKFDRLQSKYYHRPELIPGSLYTKIVERAQGVILWASLVVDEIIKEFLGSTKLSPIDFEDILDLIPSGLEALYDRILNNISAEMASGTALYMYLLKEHELSVDKQIYHHTPEPPLSDCSVEVLQQAWCYVQHICLGIPMVVEPTPKMHEMKIRVFMGDLVDIALEPSTDVVDAIKLGIFHYPSSSTWIRPVRLIHKSFSKYISETRWLDDNLDSSIKELFPNCVWRRLGLHMMQHSGELNKEISRLLKPLFDMRSQEVDHLFQNGDRRYRFSRFRLVNIEWNSLYQFRRLYVYCTALFPRFHNIQNLPTLKIAEDLFFPKNSSILHFIHCRKCFLSSPEGRQLLHVRLCRLYNNGHLDLYCTLIHGNASEVRQKLDQYDAESKASVISDAFDLLIFTANSVDDLLVDYESLLGYIKFFTGLGMRMKPAHLCGITELTGWDHERELGDLLNPQQQSTMIWHDHDPLCPTASTAPSVAHHWLHTDGIDSGNEEFLRFLICSGIDLRECFRKEGGIFHAILGLCTEPTARWADFLGRHPNPRAVRKYLYSKFRAATNFFLPSRDVPKRDLCSTLAKRLRRKLLFRLIASFKDEQSTMFHFLRTAGKALEMAERAGTWKFNVDEGEEFRGLVHRRFYQ